VRNTALSVAASESPMSAYQQILAAIALDENGSSVLQRAHQLARKDDAQLAALHVIEYLPIESGELLMTTPYDVTRELEQQAREGLLHMADQLGITDLNIVVATGPIVTQIETQARKLGSDLIIIGHQPRKGLSAWFSHVEDNLVHSTPCDVLVLRLR